MHEGVCVRLGRRRKEEIDYAFSGSSYCILPFPRAHILVETPKASEGLVRAKETGREAAVWRMPKFQR